MISNYIHGKLFYVIVLNLVLISYGWAATPHDDHSDHGDNPIWNATETDLLKRDLLAHYDKFARPSQRSNITNIELDFTVTHIDLDETKSLMTVNGWLKMAWNDDKLRWNPSDYGGLSKLHVADHEVWEPDIVLYNSALGNNIDHYGNTHVLVYPQGKILWVPPSQFIVFCSLDLLRWPFDRHTCSLKLGSWTYGGDMLDITTNTSAPMDLKMLTSNWRVVATSKKRNVQYYECCPEPYTDIQFFLTIQRDPSGYLVLVFLPAIGVMILCLSVFWIPSDSGSKFVVAATTALIQSMFLVYFSQRLLNLGPTTPLIILYYAYSMILVGISMVISIISYNMATRHKSRPVPRVLANLINSKLSAILFLPKYQDWRSKEGGGEELTERGPLDEDLGSSPDPKPPTTDWTAVAASLDRLAFFLYLLAFVGFSIKCIL